MKNKNIVVALPKDFDRFSKDIGEEDYKKHSIYETFDAIDSDVRLKIGNNIYWVWTKKEFPLSVNTFFLADKFQLKEVDLNIEDEITCPYCGYVSGDSWDDPEDDDSRYCEVCGSTFGYNKVITVDYRSYPVEKNEDIKVVK